MMIRKTNSIAYLKEWVRHQSKITSTSGIAGLAVKHHMPSMNEQYSHKVSKSQYFSEYFGIYNNYAI